MLQLSPKVHPWYNNIQGNFKDFKKFVESKINMNPATHMKDEPQPPYHILWYSRQLPFTRGDNLTIQQAEELFRKNNQVYEYNHFLTMHWHKPYFPDWFTGQSISIINDKDSLNFLKNRRDAIFYIWKDNTVYFKRFLPAQFKKKFGNTLKDHPITEKIYNSKDEFYKTEFYEDPEVLPLCKKNYDTRVKLNINLSEFWNRSGSDIATKINEVFDLDINLKKADYLLDSWLKNNLKFL